MCDLLLGFSCGWGAETARLQYSGEDPEPCPVPPVADPRGATENALRRGAHGRNPAHLIACTCRRGPKDRPRVGRLACLFQGRSPVRDTPLAGRPRTFE
ncbi:hypothetical protein thalar_02846 [Litoreibacter arenae DSM 19593]|uniref:Uncharacterized protein n=1 Tax=Litoreibacter arenae DSM 19593 TaxID=1123360 RepID=S9Q702_9RHOB|nr:hypothetical protein thalar_02846 [Litoreibacter arenae DSM 19593]